MKKIRVGILGGSGYGGSELLRLLLFHPEAKVELVTAHEQVGKPVSKVHPNLNGLTSLRFSYSPTAEDLKEIDCVFLALPHGEAMDLMPKFPSHLKVIDLSGDFRINDAQVFEQYYERPHTSFNLQPKFVYGLTEINRESIRSAQYIANPGCFASALLLGLYPLVNSGAITGKVIVDAKTGSSGSGAKASANTHHPKRANSFYAYKAFSHQHLPEVRQLLASSPSGWNEELIFQAHSAPVVRGIFASIYVTLKEPSKADAVLDIFRGFYRGARFVRLVEGSPDINWVKNSNFTDIGVAVQGENAVIFVALDNLVKGAAGQAIQNMNLMFGLDEATGLLWPASNP